MNAKNKTAELLILACGFLLQTALVSKERKVAEAVPIFKWLQKIPVPDTDMYITKKQKLW